MKKAVLISLIALGMSACGDNSQNTTEPQAKPKSMLADQAQQTANATSEEVIVGRVKEVQLNDPLDPEMVARGKAIYEMKCAACHKLTDQRVVGPGFKGVTERRSPIWIMNMIVDPDAMLEKDPVAQELLKECLVRMPNQNLTEADARDVLEFMFFNDGKPVAEK